VEANIALRRFLLRRLRAASVILCHDGGREAGHWNSDHEKSHLGLL